MLLVDKSGLTTRHCDLLVLRPRYTRIKSQLSVEKQGWGNYGSGLPGVCMCVGGVRAQQGHALSVG